MSPLSAAGKDKKLKTDKKAAKEAKKAAEKEEKAALKAAMEKPKDEVSAPQGNQFPIHTPRPKSFCREYVGFSCMCHGWVEFRLACMCLCGREGVAGV